MLRLYNTLTRKKEEFHPITDGKVLFYHCGPTVYWTQHIGNLRGMAMGDLIVRSLRYLNYAVTHVRNYTDVGHLTSDSDTGEDKMEKGVAREGLTPQKIADKYIAQFERDTDLLNLSQPTYKPRATEYISQMIDMVRVLLQKGYAYTTDLAVYFDVTKFAEYTKLNRQKMELQEEGAGKADVTDPQKKHAADFALWFFKTGVHVNALQTWQSPFSSPLISQGEGFPGWHIECSAMCRALLGKTIDIHMGGVEHIPVHHTNEIAQSEAANGVEFVRYWLHNGHLLVNGKKMAKSEGTGYSLWEVVDKGFDPLELRYFFLQAHYRSQQNFTFEAMQGSATALNLLYTLMDSWKVDDTTVILKSKEALRLQQRFNEALEDDINVPKALAVVWEVVKSDIEAKEKYGLISNFDDVLGLDLIHPQSHLKAAPSYLKSSEELPADILNLYRQRENLRKERKFDQADSIRQEIEAKGYILNDTPTKTEILRK